MFATVPQFKFKSNSGSEMEFKRNPLNSEWCTTLTQCGHQNAVLTRSGTLPAMLQLLKMLELIFHNGPCSQMEKRC